MINTRELRRGNFVKHFTRVVEIAAIDKILLSYWDDSSDNAWTGAEDFEPILLTPEVLESIGFEKCLYDYQLYLPIGYLTAWAGSGEVFVNHLIEVGDLYYNTHKSDIKHLHQLQNLYYVLTGEELEVKDLSSSDLTKRLTISIQTVQKSTNV